MRLKKHNKTNNKNSSIAESLSNHNNHNAIQCRVVLLVFWNVVIVLCILKR